MDSYASPECPFSKHKPLHEEVCSCCRYVLTQFNSHTLNTHITQCYPPAVFGGPKKQGFVDVLACHQTPDYNAWYRGSADAVRRNLPVILEQYRGAGIPEELLILSGQAVYRMVGPLAHPCLHLFYSSHTNRLPVSYQYHFQRLLI